MGQFGLLGHALVPRVNTLDMHVQRLILDVLLFYSTLDSCRVVVTVVGGIAQHLFAAAYNALVSSLEHAALELFGTHRF